MFRRFRLPTHTPSPTIVSADPDRLANMPCARCEALLEVHQPSIQSPHRLLATCTLCDAWYYLETDIDTGVATMVFLPEQDTEPAAQTAGSDEETPWQAIVGLS